MSESQARVDAAQEWLNQATATADAARAAYRRALDDYSPWDPTTKIRLNVATAAWAEAADAHIEAQHNYDVALLDLYAEEQATEVHDPGIDVLSLPEQYRVLYDTAQQAVREYLDDDLSTDTMSALGDLCGIGPHS